MARGLAGVCGSLQVNDPDPTFERHIDRMPIFGEQQLRGVLAECTRHNQHRPHRSLQQHSPQACPRLIGIRQARIIPREIIGGLINEFAGRVAKPMLSSLARGQVGGADRAPTTFQVRSCLNLQINDPDPISKRNRSGYANPFSRFEKSM